jgi:hypothetical protein
MALPKISAPRFGLIIPSNGKRISFRPFLVKEEKMLLMAAQSEDMLDMVDAVKDVIASCLIGGEESIDVEKLPYFDLEYIFLNIRAKSIGEIIKLEYRHTSGVNYQGIVCEAVTPVEINLEQVTVFKDESHKSTIKLDSNLGLELRYPTVNDVRMVSEGSDEIEMLAKCITNVYDADNVYEPDNLKDSLEFLESLNNAQFTKIMQFIETMPKLKHTFTYKCVGCGQEDTVTLQGMSDFF